MLRVSFAVPVILPEVATGANRDGLGKLGLTPQEMEDIVAFLLTPTDGYLAHEGG